MYIHEEICTHVHVEEWSRKYCRMLSVWVLWLMIAVSWYAETAFTMPSAVSHDQVISRRTCTCNGQQSYRLSRWWRQAGDMYMYMYMLELNMCIHSLKVLPHYRKIVWSYKHFSLPTQNSSYLRLHPTVCKIHINTYQLFYRFDRH